MSTPRFTGLPFVVYPVSDMARSRAFYGGVLGLRETAAWQDAWVEFDVGTGTLALSTMMAGCTPGLHGAAAALETADMAETVAHLRAHGTAFLLEPIETGVCTFARFADPDGNHLVLHSAHRDAEATS